MKIQGVLGALGLKGSEEYVHRKQRRLSSALFLNFILSHLDEFMEACLDTWHDVRDRWITILSTDRSPKLDTYEAIRQVYHYCLTVPGLKEYTLEVTELLKQATLNSAAKRLLTTATGVEEMRTQLLRRLGTGDNNSARNITLGGESVGGDETDPEKKFGGETNGDAESSTSSPRHGFVDISVYFVTDRNLLGGSHVSTYFGTERSDDISFGIMRISVPDIYNFGDRGPWPFHTTRPRVASKKLLQLSMLVMEEARFWAALHQVARSHKEPEAVCFVHGFNTRLVNACKRMAQVAYQCELPGVPLVFSWPSLESLPRYPHDESNVMWALPHFEQILRRLLVEWGLGKVHLLGHSMGCRMLIYSLKWLQPHELPPGSATLCQVVLSAADFDMGEFALYLHTIIARCRRLTLYCSSDDAALGLSRTVHGGYPRLGDFKGIAKEWGQKMGDICARIDIIDTTGLDSSWMRHMYLFTQCRVFADCCEVLRSGPPPKLRSFLLPREVPGSSCFYWQLDGTNRAHLPGVEPGGSGDSSDMASWDRTSSSSSSAQATPLWRAAGIAFSLQKFRPSFSAKKSSSSFGSLNARPPFPHSNTTGSIPKHDMDSQHQISPAHLRQSRSEGARAAAAAVGSIGTEGWAWLMRGSVEDGTAPGGSARSLSLRQAYDTELQGQSKPDKAVQDTEGAEEEEVSGKKQVEEEEEEEEEVVGRKHRREMVSDAEVAKALRLLNSSRLNDKDAFLSFHDNSDTGEGGGGGGRGSGSNGRSGGSIGSLACTAYGGGAGGSTGKGPSCGGAECLAAVPGGAPMFDRVETEASGPFPPDSVGEVPGGAKASSQLAAPELYYKCPSCGQFHLAGPNMPAGIKKLTKDERDVKARHMEGLVALLVL